MENTTTMNEWLTNGQPANVFQVFYNLWDFYIFVTFDLADPKTDGFPLLGNPFYPVIICLVYLLLVNFIIPDAMSTRKPFNLQSLLVVYNFGMVLGNVWLHYEFWMAGWGTGYNFLCENIDYDINPKTMRMANLMWWYYISKYVDMFDTMFLALRKQQNKISFLHFFHHFSMPLNAFVLGRYLPGGHCTFHGLLNSFVHIWMYLYYGIAAIGPKYRKYLWWKKYVTLTQLVQFYLDCIHLALPLFYDCGFPLYVTVYMLSQASFFLMLFTHFYISTYVVTKKHAVSSNGHVD